VAGGGAPEATGVGDGHGVLQLPQGERVRLHVIVPLYQVDPSVVLDLSPAPEAILLARKRGIRRKPPCLAGRDLLKNEGPPRGGPLSYAPGDAYPDPPRTPALAAMSAGASQ
jgi:hypothetical protein